MCSQPSGDVVTDDLHARAHALIASLSDGARDDDARDRLLCELLSRQRQLVAPYARLCQHRGVPLNAATIDAYPAVPTDVFRYTRVAAHEPAADIRVFRTSGTTSGARGQHHVRDLALYDAAAQAFAKHALFSDVERIRLVILAPHADDVFDSSLSYMLTRFVDWFGTPDSVFVLRDGQLDCDLLARTLHDAHARQQPIALLGTSFAFVHAEDSLGNERWKLPIGSRLMQTGGFKGKSREVEPEQLRAELSQRYGITEPWIVQEYGMTELSSQMYESTIVDTRSGRKEAPRRLIAPGWMRVTAVDPDTLAPVPAGDVGIARFDDLANLDTVCAIQTADRIRLVDDGFLLLGRAPGSTPRGCSLAMEEAMGPTSP